MINESYLDPDIHLWPECPDDRCYHCGYVFPADWEIEEDTPQWEGFCCQECMDASERGEKAPPCIMHMYQLLCAELGRDSAEGWSRAVYKWVNCGPWLRLAGDDAIEIGSIVEGSDVEIGPVTLKWPFTNVEFWEAIGAINEEALFYWERDNYRWFYVDFTKVGEEPVRYYGHMAFVTDVQWDSEDVPEYVKNKVNMFWNNGTGEFKPYDKPLGIALGVTITEYLNDMVF